MISRNISLPDPMSDWIDAVVNSGKYADGSEYIRELIRRDQEFQALQAAVTLGIESGEPTSLDMDSIRKKARARVGLDAKDL